MATILSEGYTMDGYEARVQLVDGRLRTLHWLSKPVDVTDAVDKAETDLKYGEIGAYRRAQYPREDDPRWLR